jgi:2-polyprenyl-3-methyl-5-hydroxy-6-metoxy-1,4-benzoquinol methylase
LNCICCGATSLNELIRFKNLPRVSSDCKPIAAGGELFICAACGHIQKGPTAAFKQEIQKFYRDYDSYHQGGGLEQMIADGDGRSRRSQVLVREVVAASPLPTGGTCIDIGCGVGAFLMALAEQERGLKLHGLELDLRNLERLKKIPGFVSLFYGDISEIAGTYDLISMIHVLEHVEEPRALLAALHEKLTPGGLVFIQVPNVVENPFDLVIADHISHFTPATLRMLMEDAGFEVVTLSEQWVKKELSLLVRVNSSESKPVQPRYVSMLATRHLDWLEATLEKARQAAVAGPFGLFGTSNAAVWLMAGLENDVDFFLDEDEARQGRDFLGKPVLPPRDAPEGATIFIGLAPVIAAKIAERLLRADLRIVLPPSLGTRC